MDRCSFFRFVRESRSLDNLPRIDQRREVEADDVHLRLETAMLNHSANDASSILPWCRFTLTLSPTLNCRSSGFCLPGTRWNIRLTEIIRNLDMRF